jgi:hypothetical protein
MAEVTGGTSPAIVFIGFMAAGRAGPPRGRGPARDGGGGRGRADRGELGEPIASFFEREGEAEFRRREEELVLGLLDRAGSGAARR